MGATHSYLSTEVALTAVVLAGALGVGYHQYTTTSGDAATSTDTNSVKKSKKKKKKAPEAGELPVPISPSTSRLVDTSSTIPGQFDEPTPASNAKTKKPKKKKAKQTNDDIAPSPTLPPTAQSQTATKPRSHPQQLSTTSLDTEGSWTRVESRHRSGRGDEHSAVDVTTSDAGLTPSVTGNSSPIEEDIKVKRETLAEKLVPKPPKTEVDDMLPEHPTLSRVMRVQPLPNEKPAPGFSWRDYEDVDADGEDDGWGVVKSKRSRPNREATVVEKPPAEETQTKRQRQNANKREAQKAAKAAAENERLAKLAKHKRELERIRMIEQAQSSSKKGKTSGGMNPVVDERGKLVWE